MRQIVSQKTIESGAPAVSFFSPRLLKRWLVRIVLAILALPFLFVLVYRFVDPVSSVPMAWQVIAGRPVGYQWQPLDKISRHLPLAVMISEDSRFCSHYGVDWQAAKKVLDMVLDGKRPRGASTLAMQTAKNLFLWQSRSYIRKAFELPLATVISLVWSKRRLMEIYLNIVEWGPGVFGAEAAALYHFNKPASALNARESALLAAALPNPTRRRAGRPDRLTRKIAGVIGRRMNKARPETACLGLGP